MLIEIHSFKGALPDTGGQWADISGDVPFDLSRYHELGLSVLGAGVEARVQQGRPVNPAAGQYEWPVDGAAASPGTGVGDLVVCLAGKLQVKTSSAITSATIVVNGRE